MDTTTIETLKAELAIANDRAAKAEAKAQSFFKDADFFMRACDAQKARAEAAENEHQVFRLQNDREWKAKVDYQKARAEAAERRLRPLQEYMNDVVARADRAEARAEAAEKDRDRLLEWNSQAGVRAEQAEDRAEAAEKALAEERRKLTTYGH